MQGRVNAESIYSPCLWRMMSGVLEYYMDMFTSVSKEVVQTKFASTWILYNLISKDVAQFKITTIHLEENIVTSDARVDFCILFLLWIFLRSEACLSSFLTSCKIIFQWISESNWPSRFRNSGLAAFLSCFFHMHYFTSTAVEQWIDFWHNRIMHNLY